MVARLPRALGPALGALLGWLAGSVLRIRRGLVERAMARAGVESPPEVARRMYRDLGRGLVELLIVAGAPASTREARIGEVALDPASMRSLDEALARGPVVLLASHTGNWELAAAAAARVLRERGRRLFVVAKPMSAGGVDAFVSWLRRACGLQTIAPKGAFGSARRALAGGDVVAMPIDQVPDRPRHAVAASFLGARALVDRAPATLAWRARAAALVVAAERDERDGGRHRVRVLEAFAPPPAEARDARAWIDSVTLRATTALERFVLGTPCSWLWLHRRWRSPVAARRPHDTVRHVPMTPITRGPVMGLDATSERG